MKATALGAGLSAVIAGLLVLFSWGELSGAIHLGWVRVPIRGIYHETGNAYEASMGTARWSSVGGPSRAVVLEAGRPLVSGNAQHDDIRNHGGGRFSFWGDNVYLSSSDNSDPRTNGRPYEAWGPGPNSGRLRAALFLLTLLAAGFAAAATRRHLIGTAAALTLLAALVAVLIRWVGIPVEGRIEAGSIARTGDSAVFVAPLPFADSWLRPLADAEASPHRSDLELFEDGRPLGPAHADAAALATGGGAFAHTIDGLNVSFTTSDASDPTANGRTYSYRTRLRASLRDAINLALVSLLLLLWGLVKKTRLPWGPNLVLGTGTLDRRFLDVLGYLSLLASVAAGILSLWLFYSGLSPSVTAWAPLQDPRFGPAILGAERWLPTALLVIAGLGHLIIPRAERPGRIGALALVPFLFCLGYFCSIYRPEPLYGLDYDPYANFLGYLPYSDAADYYGGARHLLDVGDLTAFSARRPANTTWLAIRLTAAGSLAGATLLQVIFAGVATSYLGFVVLRLFGPWSSMAVVALTYAYSRFFFTTSLSEASGITLGAIGVGLALWGLRKEDRRFLIAGMSALGLAESFRAGALLAPLGLAAGASLLARPGRRLTTGLLATGAYLATLLVSPGLNAVYGSGKGQTGANLAWVAAGLSLGETWGIAQAKYASELASMPSEVDQARFLYAAAAKNFRNDPWPAFGAIGKSFRLFRSQTPEVLGNLSGADPFGSIIIAALLAHRILRRLAVPWWLLRIAGPFTVGLALCLPVIYLDGGWRVIAASTPFIFTILSVLVASPDVHPVETTRPDRIAAWCPMLLIGAMAVLPGVARRLASFPDTSCLIPGRYVIRHPSRDPSVLYESAATTSRDGVPVITPERLQAQERYADNTLNLREPPVLLDWAYDYATHNPVSLVAPAELLYARSEFVWVTTQPLGPPSTHRWVERFGVWSGCGARK